MRKIIKDNLKCPNFDNTIIKIEKLSYPPDVLGTTLADFYYNFIDGNWHNLRDLLTQNDQQDIVGDKIFIETTESLKVNKFILNTIHSHQPAILIGMTGAGKTLTLNKLFKNLQPEKFMICKVILTY